MEVVLPASHRVSRVPWYSGFVLRVSSLSPTGLLPSMADLSRSLRLDLDFVTSYESPQPRMSEALWFGLFPVRSPLLRESLFAFFSSGYLDVSVPRVASSNLCIQVTVPAHYSQLGFPIRKSPDQSLLAAPRGISLLTASFIGS